MKHYIEQNIAKIATVIFTLVLLATICLKFGAPEETPAPSEDSTSVKVKVITRRAADPEPTEPETVEPRQIEPETEEPTLPAPEQPEATQTTEHLGEFKLTAYCTCSVCCGQWADGITASGTKAVPGRTIAVDPTVIPLGSTVYVNGIEYIAEDTGGAIKGNRIDILFPSHQEALEFGIQYADVSLIRK